MHYKSLCSRLGSRPITTIMRSLLLIGLTMAITLSSCHKYEDNPTIWLTLRPTKARLTHKPWESVEVLYNGSRLSLGDTVWTEHNGQPFPNVYANEWSLEFNKDDDNYIVTYLSGTINVVDYDNWEIDKKNDILTLAGFDYTILQFTDRKLWLHRDGYEYRCEHR